MTDGIGPTGVTPLGHEVFQIDTRMAGYEGITAGYLIRGDRPCLVETGTAPSAPVVRDALAGLGIGPGDLATVVVTHIHLDHAGGAGDIAAMFPAARIVVHQRGARHLADPSKLMAGARMVYGRALERIFGVLAPAPRLSPLHLAPDASPLTPRPCVFVAACRSATCFALRGIERGHRRRLGHSGTISTETYDVDAAFML